MSRNKWMQLAAALCAVAALSGCASVPEAESRLSVPAQQDLRQHNKTVLVTSDARSTPGAMALFRVPAASVVEGVNQSIAASKVFSQVYYGPGADYVLDVVIVRMTEPEGFGFDMKVDTEAQWTLTDAVTRKVVMQQPIVSTYTATMGTAFAGSDRFALAIRGSLRENIRLGLQAVSTLKLD